jgi:tRNA(Arg) A34 adenosine deaminase TadA
MCSGTFYRSLVAFSSPQLRNCTATIYWAHIGRVIYAATNEQLAQLTGPGNKENFTMKWHARDVLLDQQKDVEVIGPVEGMDKVVFEESDLYWSKTRQ